MNFKDFNINTINQYNTFTFNEQEVKVLKYLPIEEKFDLIMTALQKSYINGVCNYIKLRTFFNLNIAYLYTDIVFDVEDRINESELYDKLTTSGLMDLIREHLEALELMTIENMLGECVKDEKEYRNTAAAIISKLVDDLPKSAEAASNIVDTFDPVKYRAVLDFAKSINNGKIV